MKFLPIKLIIKQKPATVLLLIFALSLYLLFPYPTRAEGTRELFPILTASDTLIKRALVNVGGTGTGTCAAYDGSALQRINIEIADATSERLFLGFNVSSGGPGYFRVFDPNGNPITAAIPIPVSGQGFIPYFKNAFAGPDLLSPDGYSALVIDPVSGINGKYYIEFNSTGPLLTPSPVKVSLKLFDISVIDVVALEKRSGRLSSSSWSINAGNIADYNTTFDAKVYVLDAAGFVVSADFKNKGFAPANFLLNFNSFGTKNTGNIYLDRQSRTGNFSTPEFPVYLNNPDSLLHPSAFVGTLDTASIQVYRCKQNEFSLNFNVSSSGMTELIYDANNNGLFDNGTADRRICTKVLPGNNNLIWNGKDGNGNLLAVNTNAHFILHYLQGHINFPIYDAEVDSGGVLFTNVRPIPNTAAAHLQFFDDTLLQSNLAPPLNSNKLPTSGPQYPYQELNGCSAPCHKWEAYNGNNNTVDFGNLSTVASYLFSSRQSYSFQNVISDYYSLDAGSFQTVCKTDTIELSGQIRSGLGNSYSGSFQWIGSGTFLPNDSALVVKYIPSSTDLVTNSIRLFLKLRGTCSLVQDSVKIGLNSPPTAASAGPDTISCQQTTFLIGNAALIGTGNWSVISGNASVLTPNSENSSVQLNQTGFTTLRWKISNGVCPSSSDFVTLNYTPVTVSLFGIDTNYCVLANPVLLDNTRFLANSIGGAYSFKIDGNMVLQLDPSNLSIGQHKLSVLYTEPTAGSCIAEDSLLFSIGGSCNKAPIAVDDYLTIGEDSSVYAVSVLLNDTDPNPLDTLKIQTSPVLGPIHGSLLIYANGTFDYTPNLNYFGADFFTYQICDTANACDTASVHILMQAINDAPYAIADSAITNEDGIASSSVLDNDYDVENNHINLDTIPAIPPLHGILQFSPDGSFIYTPAPNFNGLDYFTYKICDDGIPSSCAFGLVKIMVSPVNDPPQANFGRKTTFEDVPNALNVLSNDVDIDGNLNPSSLNIIAYPVHGNAIVDANTNKINYFPFPNYYGNDTIVYEVCDLGFPIYCDTSITFITVIPVNDAPVSSADFASTAEDNQLTGSSLLNNDFDLDGDSLFIDVLPTEGPNHGTLSLAINGTYAYLPNSNFNGSDFFIYTVCDNGSPNLCMQDTAYITINAVNDAPIVSNNRVVTSLNTAITANVLANDFDIDLNINSASLSIVIAPLHGTANANSNGTISYNPQGGFFGVDSLLYSVCDSGSPVLCASAKLIIEVGYVNLPPQCLNDTVNTQEDSPIGVSILNNDSDPNNNIDLSSIQIITPPLHGSYIIDYFNGTIQYSPFANFFGKDTLVYSVCDVGTISNCDTAAIFISIASVNDAPSAQNDTLITDEDFSIIGNVLTNDFDNDAGDILSITTQVNNPPQHGVLQLSSNGIFNYTPHANYFGTDFFNYQVCDNGQPSACSVATVVIKVGSINDAPQATNDVVIVPLNSSSSVYVLNNDFDVDGNLNPGSLAITGLPTNGIAQLDTLSQLISYSPNPNYFGLDTIVYSICDFSTPSLCVQAYLIFNVGATNNPPVANPDFVLTTQNNGIDIAVLQNDFDVDGNLNRGSIDVLVNTSNGNLTLDLVNGIINYQPMLGFSGMDTLVYEICDGGLPVFCDTAIVVINVNGNQKPFANPDFIVSSEDVSIAGASLLANDSDPENGTFAINSTPIINPLHGALTINSNGTFSFYPSTNYNGTDFFVYEICDNGSPSQCDTAIVSILIAAINDAPNALNDTISLGQGANISSNILGNDYDVDSPNLTASLVVASGPYHGVGTLSTSGLLSYTAAPGYSGIDSLRYLLCDNQTPSLCDTASVYFTIGTNLAPIAIDDTFSINEDIPLLNTSFLLNDSDPEGTQLLLNTIPAFAPIHGNLQLNTNGSFTYTPNSNFFGNDSFLYVVCDAGFPSKCDTGQVTISILSINDEPIAGLDSFSVNSNTQLSANVSSNDTDVDGPNLIVSTVSGTQNGSLVLSTNGQFTYSPSTNFFGSDSFTYEICDGGNPTKCDTALVVLTVINQAPLAFPDSFEIHSSTPLTANCILNDVDPENGILTLKLFPVVNVAHGTVTLRSNGTFNYMPLPGFTGVDFFIYSACDNASNPLCADTKVSIRVLNDAPIAVNDTIRVASGTVYKGNVQQNDSDAELGFLISNILQNPLHGSLQLQSDGNFEFAANSGFAGIDWFSYELCDDGVPFQCDTAQVFITIFAEENELVIPNAISPNGDNINDILIVEGINHYPQNEFKIYDRDGKLVFSANPYQNNWGGLNKEGKMLPNGSYFYVFDKKDGSSGKIGYIIIGK